MSKKDKNQNTPDTPVEETTAEKVAQETPVEAKKITADKLEEKKKKKDKKKKEKKSGDDSADKKSKLKIIIPIVAALVLLIAIVVIILVKKADKVENTLFADSNYPAYIKGQKGTLVVSLKSLEEKDKNWVVRVDNPDLVKITEKGKQKDGNGKFVLTPQAPGVTEVDFVKTVEYAGVQYDLFTFGLPVYVSENAQGYSIEYLEGSYQQIGYYVVGENTDYPIVLSGNSDNLGLGFEYEGEPATETDAEEEEETAGPKILGNLNFVNGKNDWEISSENDVIKTGEYEKDGMLFVTLSYSESGAMVGDESRATDTDAAPEDAKGHGTGNGSDATSISSAGDAAEGNATTGDASAVNTNNGSNKAVLILSSQSLGITKKFNVEFFSDGNMLFTPVAEK